MIIAAVSRRDNNRQEQRLRPFKLWEKLMSENTVDDDQDEGGRPDECPDAIAPGSFGFTFWRVDSDGNDIGTDVGFTWDGESEADWYQDISSKTEGLSVMSSSPVGGTLRWPNGQDVEVTYSASDFDIEGETVLGVPLRSQRAITNATSPPGWNLQRNSTRWRAASSKNNRSHHVRRVGYWGVDQDPSCRTPSRCVSTS